MRTLQNPVFLISFFLFCVNQLLELNSIYVKPLYSYLDDLLCLPIVLTLVLTVERMYFKNNRFVFSWHYTGAAVVLFAVFFELLLPSFSHRHTSDVLDIAFYMAGAVLFHTTINKPVY